MCTGDEPCMGAAADPGVLATAQSGVITTTLYDLIEAIGVRMAPDDEGLVVATVVRLLHSSRLRFLGREECRIVVL